jgi:hypothetical protein
MGTIFCTALVLLLAPSLRAQGKVQMSLPAPLLTSIGDAITIEVNALLDVKVIGGGRVLVVEGRPPRVGVFGPDGHVEWENTRVGIGPNALQFPYRIAESRNGVTVLDIGSKSLLWMDRNGRYLRRTNLGLDFATVSDVSVLRNGQVVIAGISSDYRARGFALHLFDRNLMWLRSFVGLPQPLDARSAGSTLVGSLTLLADETLLFASSLTAETIVLAADLRVRQRLPLRGVATTRLDSLIARVNIPGRSEKVTVNQNASILTQVLGGPNGGVLAIVRSKEKFVVQAYRADGTVWFTKQLAREADGVPIQTELQGCSILTYKRGNENIVVRSVRFAHYFSIASHEDPCV